ncbi:MAG TPA: VOC family protein [Candidatus Moranbacteria bacterium]|nr:VOC family protein [Candidatus Moranbacteria bacterium]
MSSLQAGGKQKIIPFLWFNHEAEEAAEYYVSVFQNAPGADKDASEIVKVSRYDKESAKASGRPEGSVMTVSFRLAGQDFDALNGGNPPGFATSFTGAISFVVSCRDQAEVDYFWEKLSTGGKKSVCGWIERDRFGITWQVVPQILTKMLEDPDKGRAQGVMEAMLQMDKIDIATLEKAYKG